LHNHYPSYLAWEEFVAIQQQLATNQAHYRVGKSGAPRKGQALLQGIAVCGRCGARMRLRYSGDRGEFPVYTCTYAQGQTGEPRCQEVRALGVDAAVERLVLAALAPDQLAIALAALGQLEAEDAALRKQWDLRRERARYDAERARRQYDTVEPENRLVARTLERVWEEKLRSCEQIEQEYQAWLRHHQVVVTEEDRREILACGADLPTLWHAPTTTAADRKQILRLLVQSVILDQQRAVGQVWFQINWQTGAISEHAFDRRVQSYQSYAHQTELRQRIAELNAGQRMDEEIAVALNAEGLRTAHGDLFTGALVWMLRKKWGIVAIRVKAMPTNPPRWDDGTYSIDGAAATLGVYSGTIHKWLRVGRLDGCQLAKGMPWQIPITDEKIETLRVYVAHARRSRREAE
jgi:hypothetical protein